MTPSLQNINTELYEILEIRQSAPREEIKKAYRRQALLHHPDKNPGHEAQFKLVNRAHNILIDDKMRRIYDKYGEIGISLYENVKSVQLVELLLNTQRTRWILISIISILVILCIFPFLLGARIAGTIGWSFSLVFLPLWIFYFAFWFGGIAILILSLRTLSEMSPSSDQEKGPASSTCSGLPQEVPPEKEEEVNRFVVMLIMIILSVVMSFILFQTLLIALRLDGWIRWRWWRVFLPYFILDTLLFGWNSLSTAIIVKSWDEAREEVISKEEKELPWPKSFFVFKSMKPVAMRYCFMLLLLMKVGGANYSWNWVFLTLYIPLLLGWIIRFQMDRIISQKASLPGSTDPIPSLDSSYFYLKHAIYLIILIWSFTFLLLLNLQLNDPGPSRFSWHLVFAPFYLLSVIGLIGVILLGILLYKFFPSIDEIRASMGSDSETSSTPSPSHFGSAGNNGSPLSQTAFDDNSPLGILSRLGLMVGPRSLLLT